MKSGTKVLVTGGAGFIGSHLVDRLLEEGCDVRVLDNFATGHRANLDGTIDDIELVEGDMQSYERCHNAVRGCEVVFHVGALPSVPRSIQDPLTSTNANVIATLNILLASRDEDVARVVYSSSSSVYGANEQLPKHEDLQPLPIAPYAVSKLAAEGYCRSFTQVYELETVALRYFNVFGPRQDPFSQYSAVMPLFISAFLEDRRPLVYGDGEQSRDFTYIDNAVDANVLAARAASGAVAGQRFNVACGEQISLNRILEQLRALSGKEIEAVYRDPRPGDIRHSLADVSHAQESLGYEPRVAALDGIGRAYEYYRGRREET
jgi:nucleoside-diphosphate-sugar epimerase